MDKQPATVVATFEVFGGYTEVIELPDITGMSVDQIVDVANVNVSGISLCHECGHEINDPSLGDVTSLVINDVDYVYVVNSGWRRADEV